MGACHPYRKADGQILGNPGFNIKLEFVIWYMSLKAVSPLALNLKLRLVLSTTTMTEVVKGAGQPIRHPPIIRVNLISQRLRVLCCDRAASSLRFYSAHTRSPAVKSNSTSYLKLTPTDYSRHRDAPSSPSKKLPYRYQS